jgi:hypothetical protein
MQDILNRLFKKCKITIMQVRIGRFIVPVARVYVIGPPIIDVTATACY